MKYTPKKWRNGTSADAVARSGARPPAGTALQPAHRVGLFELDTAFILANGKRYPAQMGQVEVEAFLTCLAIQAQVSAGTQNRALAALLLFSCNVLRIDRHHVSDESPGVQYLE